MIKRNLATVLLTLMAACLLSSCHQQPQWYGRDISGLMPKLAFHLTDEQGKPVTAANYRGKIVMLFFGYTNCPDYCPTTLSRLARVLDSMPNERKAVRILFVSVDPGRDTPHRLAVYTSNFAPEITGLTGSQAQLRALAKRYRTTFSYGQPNKRGNYVVTHGLAVYVFDNDGNARLVFLNLEHVQQIAGDLKQLERLST